MSNRAESLVKNSIIMFIGSVLTKGINFIMAPLFIRWLSMEDYGTFDLLSTYSMLLIPIIALGIHHAVFRFLIDSDSLEEKGKIVINSIVINLVGFIVYIIIISAWMVMDRTKISFLILLTLLLFSQSFQNYVGMYIRGLKKLNLYTIINVICTSAIMVGVTFFVKIFDMGLDGIVLGYSFGYLFSALCGVIFTRTSVCINFKDVSVYTQGKMLKYSLPMVPNSIAWWILNISDRIIVSGFLGVASSAILAVANKIPNLCITFFEVFQTAWVENATEAIKDSDWEDYFTKIVNVVGRFVISVATVIVITNFFVFRLLFTSEYSWGMKIVPILSIAVVFSAMGQFLGSVFVAEYNSKKQGITITEAGVINLFVHILLIKSMGLYAAPLSTLVAYVALFLIRFYDLRKKYKVKINKKTYVSFFILVASALVGYLNNEHANVVVIIVAGSLLMLINRDILSLLLLKVKKIIKIK